VFSNGSSSRISYPNRFIVDMMSLEMLSRPMFRNAPASRPALNVSPLSTSKLTISDELFIWARDVRMLRLSFLYMTGEHMIIASGRV